MAHFEKTVTEIRIQLETEDSINLELFGLATCAPGWQGFSHVHDFWEVLYILKDQEDPHQLICEDVFVENTANTLYLVPPGKRHIFKNNGKLQNKNLYAGFTYRSDAAHTLSDKLPLIIKQNTAEIIGITSEMRNLVMELSQENSPGLNSKRFEMMYCILRLIRYLSESGGGDGRSMNSQIKDVCQYLEMHIDKPIQIRKMAQVFCVSPNYLGQRFKKAMGITIKDYHNRVRMDIAKQLLSTGEYTVSETAYKTGFQDAAYFSRKFKESFGVPPSMMAEYNDTPERTT